MERRSVKLVIDYQNIHLTGHGVFVPDSVPRHESLIHPLLRESVAVRAQPCARQHRDRKP
ncbi:hypothetical protein GCM10025864_44660 [Luteimicrobium album]|uniref:Uncharacterized protein n=1 Tax=Luteimicrobium album TaxID=1054550 RepID=A0ABQ6I8F9_9MICO|nr:hypothetical protein GCM10025864_44660 [Luteimicrobium album]